MKSNVLYMILAFITDKIKAIVIKQWILGGLLNSILL